MKTNLKLFITIIVAVIAIILLGTKVQATEVTEQELQTILDLIPNTMNLDVKEVEYDKATGLIGTQIEQVLKSNNIEYKKESAIKLTNKTINAQNVEITFYSTPIYMATKNLNDFYTAHISIGDANYNTRKEKTIQIVYNNHSKYNSTDANIIKGLTITSPHYYETDFKDISWEEFFKIIETYHNSRMKDKSIVIKADSGAGDGTPINNLFTGERRNIYSNI